MVRLTSRFKYSRIKYAEALVARGSIRVGTLHEFRNAELGPAIGDAGEGTTETTHAFDEPVNIGRRENQSWVTQKMFKLEPGADMEVSGLSLVVLEVVLDCFIYCASHQLSRRSADALDADACVEIRHPERSRMPLSEAYATRGTSLARKCNHASTAVGVAHTVTRACIRHS